MPSVVYIIHSPVQISSRALLTGEGFYTRALFTPFFHEKPLCAVHTHD